MGGNLRNVALWVIIVLLLLALFTLFQNPTLHTGAPDMSFSQFLSEVDQGRVRDVVIQGPDIRGTLVNGRSFQSYGPSEQSWMQRLYGKGASITIRPQRTELPGFMSLLVSWLPFVALIGVWVFLSRQVHGAGGSWFMKAMPPADEIASLKRKVEDLQKQLDQRSGKDKT
jgi:cell division protease FtsH